MSIFNKPYKTDKQMRANAKKDKSRRRQDQREMKNTLADQIFKAVRDAIDGGKEDFTKKEMVELVSKAKKSTIEWIIWDKACTVAIQKIRRYYWNDEKDATDKRMFNYVRDINKYWLIPIDGQPASLGASVVYESYDRKVKGLARKQRQIATSVYKNIIELDVGKRKELISKMREQHLLENGD